MIFKYCSILYENESMIYDLFMKIKKTNYHFCFFQGLKVSYVALGSWLTFNSKQSLTIPPNHIVFFVTSLKLLTPSVQFYF